MKDPNCLFCKIVEGVVPSFKIYEDEQALAFLDINPFEEGHCLVIPKYHAETLPDLPEDVFVGFSHAIHRTAKLVKEKLGSDGFNVLQSNGKCATQVIPHVHFHIIPRWNNRPLNWAGRVEVDMDALVALHRRIMG